MTHLKPHPDAEKRFKFFSEQIFDENRENIHSIYLTGSVITDDFDPKHSDINSVFMLKEIDLQFLKNLAPMGKKFSKKRIAAPLIMTPDYMRESLDVFPIEFLNIRMLHYTWAGEDLFKDIKINPADLRWQCERELKIKLIGLRQNYISSMGNRRLLSDVFIQSFSGYIPLFRGIIMLNGKEPSLAISDVLSQVETATGIGMDPFHRIWNLKRERLKLPTPELNSFFENCYTAIEKISDGINALEI